MALVLADRVQEVTTTSGTGTITLNGAVAGFQSFLTGIGSGNTTYYTIYDPTTYEWEVGIGTFTSSGTDTLSRDTVLSNSLGTTAKINLAGNQTNVFVTYPSEKSVNLNTDGVMEVGEPLSYPDTDILATFVSTVAGYNQVVIQNKSTATNASANLNVSNDASTASNGFAELGINSSTFSNGPGCFNIPGAAYVASAGNDLSIGTYNAYDIHFATNSSTTDAMTIFDNGGTSLGGYGNPGIGNLAVNKIVSGVSTITATGGTTVLNAASTYYQEVVGTTTQTIQLPDATTLLNGTTFIIDNNSTGNVTVTDFATSSLDVIPTGGLAYIYLVSNSTVAGSWTSHGYLPGTYNFNTTNADFGNATITNAVWNGTTISPAYGGTGLTSFVAANNALYSTGATTLTAGTLPVAAGGTGQTTANAALNALLPSQTSNSGKYLTTNGTDTSWATVTQTSFSAGTTGFTPSTPTSGAVTLAGTLNVANGGTGTSTAFTDGSVVFAGVGGIYSQDNANFNWNDSTNNLTAYNISILDTKIRLGQNAGATNQASTGTAVGADAGKTNQGFGSVAIGVQAAEFTQGDDAIAIGTVAGNSNQGANAIAIGESAGATNQGANAIAIGNRAGIFTSHANSIMLNATGSNLASPAASTFTVKPVAATSTTSNLAAYNSTTGEVSYSSTNYVDSSGKVGIGTASTSGYNLAVAGSILSGYQKIKATTSDQYTGMGIAGIYNATSADGYSYIDFQGRNEVTDSSMIVGHRSNFSSYIFFSTQPAGTNTDRRTTKVLIDDTTTFYSDITVGSGQVASTINMADSDEGTRQLHCNSNRIGFLNQAGNWGSYCLDDGSWQSDFNITALSDERKKKNWRPVTEDYVEKLANVKVGVYDRIDADLTQVGVSAQSLQKVLREAVIEDKDGYLAVAYGNAALVSAIELAKEVVKLKELVNDLQSQLEEIKRTL